MKSFLSRWVTVSLLFAATSSFGQGIPDSRFPSHVDLSITPTALIHPDPSIRLGAEYVTKNGWGFVLNGGGSKFRQFRNDKRANFSYYEIRPEIRYYWFQGKDIGWNLPQDVGAYLGLEAFFANSRYSIENSNYYAGLEQVISFAKADFHKEKFGGQAKIGLKFLVGRKLSVDIFSGVGLARTDVSFFNIIAPQSVQEETGFRAEDFYDGKNVLPQFSLGFKVGLRLWEE